MSAVSPISVVHQLIDGFRPTDAMGQAAVSFQRLLRIGGRTGEIFAREVDAQWHSVVRPLREFSPGPESLVLYHHGIASPLVSRLLHGDHRKGLVYHNITPAHFYRGTALHRPLLAGRSQLSALVGHVELAIGVSEFNCAELRDVGFDNVSTVRLPIEPARFATTHADAKAARRFRELGSPLLLTVGRVVAHKKVDDVISVLEALLPECPNAHLLVVGSCDQGSATYRAFRKRAQRLKAITHLQRMSHAELVAAYRSADVYLSMSEHEGIGMPLLEAFAAQLPVLAFSAAAVPETLSGHGVMFDRKDFAHLAQVAQQVATQPELRQQVVDGQTAHLRRYTFAESAMTLSRALATLESAHRVQLKPRQRQVHTQKAPRVAVVVQRFGERITGGAEAHARQIAERLAQRAQVHVFTSCADDHLTWRNVFTAGDSKDGRLTVRRFPSRVSRSMPRFNRLSKARFSEAQSLTDEVHWLAEQGPLLEGFESALVEAQNDFDAFIFFTALYAPTAWGLPLVADKALLVPTAHDEPAMQFESYADVFTMPRALLCNTIEEEAFIRKRFPHAAPSEVVGVGVEPQLGNGRRFRERFHVQGDYLLYLGRHEGGKGLELLVKCFEAATAASPRSLTLVMAGAGDWKTNHPGVRLLGRIDETSKWDGLSDATAVVVPSALESLSLLMLEAFAVGTPVLGNRRSPVVEGQLRRSGGGLGYSTPSEFVQALSQIRMHRARFSSAALIFSKRYQWPSVLEAYWRKIETLSGERSGKGRK